MNEEFNPYAQPEEPATPQEYSYAPQPPQPAYQPQEQQSAYQQPAEVEQPEPQPVYQQPQQPQYIPQQYQQPTYQPPQYQQYQQYQQPQNYYYYQQPVQKSNGNGMAKAFTIVSFVAGCLSLLIALSTVFSGFSSSSDIYEASGVTFIYGLILGIPGLIFGIVALTKKTPLVPMAVLGVVFNTMLIFSFFISFSLAVSGTYGY